MEIGPPIVNIKWNVMVLNDIDLGAKIQVAFTMVINPVIPIEAEDCCQI